MDFQYDGYERRHGLKTDTGHARRFNDKLFSFIFWALLIFLLGMIFGCSSAKRAERLPAQCNLAEYAMDFRCQAYVPDDGPELDDFGTIDEE